MWSELLNNLPDSSDWRVQLFFSIVTGVIASWLVYIWAERNHIRGEMRMHIARLRNAIYDLQYGLNPEFGNTLPGPRGPIKIPDVKAHEWIKTPEITNDVMAFWQLNKEKLSAKVTMILTGRHRACRSGIFREINVVLVPPDDIGLFGAAKVTHQIVSKAESWHERYMKVAEDISEGKVPPDRIEGRERMLSRYAEELKSSRRQLQTIQAYIEELSSFMKQSWLSRAFSNNIGAWYARKWGRRHSS